MDFLVENEDKPVPADLGSVSEQKPPAGAAAGAGDEDDDDAAALQAALGMSMKPESAAEGATSGEGGSSGGVAQVLLFLSPVAVCSSDRFAIIEHQVHNLWQDIPRHRSCKLPRRKVRS